jgi:hypothetical protein
MGTTTMATSGTSKSRKTNYSNMHSKGHLKNKREYCTAWVSLRGLTDPTVSCNPTKLCIYFWGPHG